MPNTAASRSPAPPALTAPGGQVGVNGKLVHEVLVQTKAHGIRKVTFTQHSPDRYTVFGLSPLGNEGLSIERRGPEREVLVHDSGAMWPLGLADRWVASRIIAGSHYGVLAVGATAQEAYAKTFNRFNS